ncbi:MAG: hypothetical protein ACTSVV_03670 [Promethearchaeota archaeon]
MATSISKTDILKEFINKIFAINNSILKTIDFLLRGGEDEESLHISIKEQFIKDELIKKNIKNLWTGTIEEFYEFLISKLYFFNDELKMDSVNFNSFKDLPKELEMNLEYLKKIYKFLQEETFKLPEIEEVNQNQNRQKLIKRICEEIKDDRKRLNDIYYSISNWKNLLIYFNYFIIISRLKYKYFQFLDEEFNPYQDIFNLLEEENDRENIKKKIIEKINQVNKDINEDLQSKIKKLTFISNLKILSDAEALLRDLSSFKIALEGLLNTFSKNEEKFSLNEDEDSFQTLNSSYLDNLDADTEIKIDQIQKNFDNLMKEKNEFIKNKIRLEFKQNMEVLKKVFNYITENRLEFKEIEYIAKSLKEEN